jgi:hypothetical protein
LIGAMLLAAVGAARPAIGAAQEGPDADGAFRDPAARALILRAREARARDIEGMSSYEGILREHIYVGLSAARFRRERGLFEQERVARLRWSADGDRAIQWLGARQAIPIVGADTRRDEILAEGRMRGAGAEVQADLRRELPEDLLGETDLPGFAFDPAGDRLAFGDDWALHPLADSAEAHYRFASGDTLRLALPDGRTIVLQEVRVEPRRADFHLVAGSLWFDAESASLVRASYKPARPFNLLLDEPDDAEDVPGFLQPVEAELSYITVEYSLQEFRYWLPRRFALEGEARLGRVITIPLTVEWVLTDYRVNEDATDIPVTGPLPPGWSRQEQKLTNKETGEVTYVTVIVPETTELLTAPELSQDFGQREPTAFTDDEVNQLKGELDQLLPTHQRFRPRWAWGLQDGLLRYNRVEGLSAGASTRFPLSTDATLTLMGRVGTGDREPNGVVTLDRGSDAGRVTLAGYHELRGTGDWSNPLSFTSSLGAILFGSGTSQFYRATGASFGYAGVGRRTRLEATAFYEDHAAVEVNSTFSVLGQIRDDTVATVLAADAVRVQGVRGRLGWFSGVDPRNLVLTGELLGEAALGDVTYQRAAATLSASHPLPAGLAGALEVGAGALWGDPTLQRLFVLGGSRTLRGFQDEAARGASFWRARAEVASGFPGARLTLFSDAGWAGPREDWSLNDPLVSVGVGASLMDGIIRFDLARGVHRGRGWKVHVYLDGLF